MAKKDKDDKDKGDKKEEKKPLTPEERIAKLEKNRLFSWIAVGILLVLVLAEAGLIFMGSDKGPDPRVTELEQRFEVVTNEVKLLESAYDTAQGFNDNAKRLEEKLDRIMLTIQLNNFSALRKLMIEQEQSYQQFLTALQQGMYDISRMVKGSRTWFEVYKEDIDLIKNDSQKRSEKLKSGLIEPLNRQTVTAP